MSEGPPRPAVDVPAVPQIPRSEMVARLRDPSLTIVNVLPREAWASQRIPGSLSLPMADITRRASVVLPDRNADIAVYCASPT
jgi:rhodanese-related sulfurtransferase